MMSYFNKYYYGMKSQYNNISMLKLKQLRRTGLLECDVVCNHSMIDKCGKSSHDSEVKSSEVFLAVPKIDKEGLSTRKSKNRNIVNDFNIDRLCWKSTRRKFS